MADNHVHDHSCSHCGAEAKYQNGCQWEGCDNICEDGRVLTLTRMNPYIKYASLRLCNVHLIELSKILSSKLKPTAFVGSSTNEN